MKLPEPVSVDQYPYGIHSYYTEAQMREMYEQGLEDACKRLTDAGWHGLTDLIKGKEDE